MIKAKNSQKEVKDVNPVPSDVNDESKAPSKNECKDKLNDDWFKTSPKLPMPLFKPTETAGK